MRLPGHRGLGWGVRDAGGGGTVLGDGGSGLSLRGGGSGGTGGGQREVPVGSWDSYSEGWGGHGSVCVCVSVCV